MKNLHVLKSDKPSRLHLGNSGLVLCVSPFNNGTISSHHIYITSDEEIKEGDWLLIIDDFETYVHEYKGDNLPTTYYKKIILTTDQDLIKDGIQAIDDTFLEWFVKNPSCERVKVNDWLDTNGNIAWGGDKRYQICNHLYNKIIISKEEPKQELHICKYCGAETTQSDDECYAKPKQETLEEAAKNYIKLPLHKDIDEEERYYNSNIKSYDAFIKGAKWQAEQSEHKISEAYERGLNALIPLIENLQSEISKLKNKI
jgi:hypothetical protein